MNHTTETPDVVEQLRVKVEQAKREWLEMVAKLDSK